MATRERRLAEFNGNGEPPPDQPVQVLCEDHSGTYQLPFACRWVDGEWRNSESGSTVEATWMVTHPAIAYRTRTRMTRRRRNSARNALSERLRFTINSLGLPVGWTG